ncbi:type IV pilin [Methanoculleus bourgensis]|nr:type IV pilin [Methanoculleus bourgensis]
MTRYPGEEGVSEVIGVVLLVGVTVLAVAVMAALFLSGPQPDEIPHATIVAGNKSGSLTLAHEGGDPLREGEYRIYIENESGFVDGTGSFSKPEDGVWSIGGALVYNGTEKPERVVVTAISGGGETILAEPEFRGGGAGFSPDPVGPGVTQDETPVPGPTLEEIIISPGIGTSLEIGTSGNDKSFDFAAIIERDDTERVDLFIYNYDKFNKIDAGTMTRDETVAFCYNKTVDINGKIGDIGDRVSITVIAYNTTGVTVSQSVLATIQQK